MTDLLSNYQNPLFMGGNCFAMKHQSVMTPCLIFSHILKTFVLGNGM